MDKQLAGLDPKTQETYHRVMNTPVTAAPAPLQPAPPVQTAPPPPPTAPTSTTTTTPIEPVPQDQTTQQIVTPTLAVQVPQPPPTINEANSQVFSSKKKAGGVPPVITVLGVVVFFVVYTMVWVKIFNARLPFLP